MPRACVGVVSHQKGVMTGIRSSNGAARTFSSTNSGAWVNDVTASF